MTTSCCVESCDRVKLARALIKTDARAMLHEDLRKQGSPHEGAAVGRSEEVVD